VKKNEDANYRTSGFEFIGVSVCAIVHDGNGNILLMKRGPKARDERGCWDICGGELEHGETIDSAIRRELMEELSVEAIDIEFLTAYEAHRIIDNKKSHWVALAHSVQVDPNKVTNAEPHKISEIGWFDLDNLPTPRHSQFDKNIGPAIKAKILK
jgi:8-oxo-dGTP diphosphatase